MMVECIERQTLVADCAIFSNQGFGKTLVAWVYHFLKTT